jgi:hypothetical protein
MAMATPPPSAANVMQRLGSKEWNVRLGAIEELSVMLNEANEGSVSEFVKFGKYIFFYYSIYIFPFSLTQTFMHPHHHFPRSSLYFTLFFCNNEIFFTYSSIFVQYPI